MCMYQIVEVIWVVGFLWLVLMKWEVDFVEQNFGCWQGMNCVQFIVSWFVGLSWFVDINEFVFGGESFMDFYYCICCIIEWINFEVVGQDIIVVVYGGIIKVVLGFVFDGQLEWGLFFDIDNCLVI